MYVPILKLVDAWVCISVPQSISRLFYLFITYKHTCIHLEHLMSTRWGGTDFSRGNFPDWDIPNTPRDKEKKGREFGPTMPRSILHDRSKPTPDSMATLSIIISWWGQQDISDMSYWIIKPYWNAFWSMKSTLWPSKTKKISFPQRPHCQSRLQQRQ